MHMERENSKGAALPKKLLTKEEVLRAPPFEKLLTKEEALKASSIEKKLKKFLLR